MKNEPMKEKIEALRKAGFSVYHNLHCIEDSPDGCTTPEEDLNDYFWLEFMDRSSQAFEFFNRSIGDHHVLCKDSKARELSAEISSKLWDLYQYAGRKFFDTVEQIKLDAKADAEDRDR